jgi:hypothetical protein
MRFAKIILLLLIVFGCDTSNNTPDPFENFFIRYYGSDGYQVGVDMVVNEDGTFMLLGNSSLSKFNDDSQVYLVKVNHDGIVLWEKFYGGSGYEMAKDIEPLSNGGFVILADRVTAAKGTDIYFFTIDQDGNKIDEGGYAMPGSSNEIGNSITPIVSGTSPNGFIVAGFTDYDSIGFKGITALFPRFIVDGSKYSGAWTDFAGADKDDYGTRAIQTTSVTTPFSFFGFTNSEPIDPGPGFNYWAMPVTETMGEVTLTTALLDGSPNDSDELLGSVSLSAAGVLMLGVLSKGTGNDQVFIAKTDQLGNTDLTLSPKIIDGINLGEVSESPVIRKVTATRSISSSENIGYLIAANTKVSGNSDIVLTKIDEKGDVIWDAPVVLGGGGEDYECAVHELSDGRILLFGTMQLGNDRQSKMALMKLNAKGQFKD